MPLKKYIFSLAYSAVLKKTLGIILGRICIFNKYQQKREKNQFNTEKKDKKFFPALKCKHSLNPAPFSVMYRQHKNETQRALTELSEFL